MTENTTRRKKRLRLLGAAIFAAVAVGGMWICAQEPDPEQTYDLGLPLVRDVLLERTTTVTGRPARTRAYSGDGDFDQTVARLRRRLTAKEGWSSRLGWTWGLSSRTAVYLQVRTMTFQRYLARRGSGWLRPRWESVYVMDLKLARQDTSTRNFLVHRMEGGPWVSVVVSQESSLMASALARLTGFFNKPSSAAPREPTIGVVFQPPRPGNLSSSNPALVPAQR